MMKKSRKKLHLDIPNVWDSFTKENFSILFDAFTHESKMVLQKWYRGETTSKEHSAVANFLVDIGAVQLQVKSNGGNTETVEVRCTKTDENTTLCLPRLDRITEFGDLSETGVRMSSAQAKFSSQEKLGEPMQGVNTDHKSTILRDEYVVHNDDRRSYDDMWLPDNDWDNSVEVESIKDEVREKKNEEFATEDSKPEWESVQNQDGVPPAILFHRCKFCDSIFTRLLDLDLHVLECEEKSSSDLKYNCYLCEKSYGSVGRISGHLCKVHKIPSAEVLEKVPTLLGAVQLNKSKPKGIKDEVPNDENRNGTFGETDEKEMVDSSKPRTRQKYLKRMQTDKTDYNESEDYAENNKIDEKESLDSFDDNEEWCPPAKTIRQRDKNVKKIRYKTKSDTVTDKPEQGSSRLGMESGGKVDSAQETEEQTHTESMDKIGEGKEIVGVIENSVGESKNFDQGEGGPSSSLTEERSEEKRWKDKQPVSKCHLCGETFKNATLCHYHVTNVHFGMNHICSTCGKEFTSKCAYKAHLLMHTKKPRSKPEPISCHVCSKTFKIKGYLDKHLKEHSTRQNLSTYECDICQAVLSSKGALAKHMNSKHTQNKKYFCEYCGKVYFIKYHLTRHLKTHTSSRDFKCDQCDAAFFEKDILASHTKNVHGNEVFLCDLCGSNFKSKMSLAIHIRSKHSSKPSKYICDICGKDCKFSTHFKNHMNMHYDIRPFKCTLCDKGFRQRAQLTVHMNWHDGIHNFKCSVCDKTFLIKGNLDKHMKKKHKSETVHPKEPICKKCGYSSNDLTAFQNHMASIHNIHEGTHAMLENERGKHGKSQNVDKHRASEDARASASLSMITMALVAQETVPSDTVSVPLTIHESSEIIVSTSVEEGDQTVHNTIQSMLC